MKNRIFIFSTREIKKEGLFREERIIREEVISSILFREFKLELESFTSIIQYVQSWLSLPNGDNEAIIKNIVKEKVQNADPSFLDYEFQAIKKGDADSIRTYLIENEKYLDLLPADIIQDKYYEILNNENDRVLAVNLLKHNLLKDNNKRWIEALKDAFGEDADSNTKFYFLLHDEDLEGYRGVDFRVLSKDNSNDNILVFQHTINPAVWLLNKKEDIIDEKIADEIEAIFYRLPFKEMIIKYIDKKFSGENVENAKDDIAFFLEKFVREIDLKDENDKLKELYTDWYLKDIEENFILKLNDLIDEQPLISKEENKDNIYCADTPFRIVVENLSTFQFHKNKQEYIFHQDKLIFSEKKENTEQIPIIHISLFDFLDDSEDSEIKRLDLAPYLPRYKNIIDSSIWNYYVPYHPYRKKDDFKARFESAINNICKNYANRLYSLPKSKEYADLMSRLVEESYLEGKGHRAAISPFLFHSENKMKKVSDNIIRKAEKQEFKKRSWRFLLVDDEAFVTEKELKEWELSDEEKNNRTTVAIKKSKCEIIKNLFGSDDFDFVCMTTDTNYIKKCQCTHKNTENEKECGKDKIKIEVVCARSNETAYKKIASSEKFDIVLMDYLLGECKEKTIREYSNKLLQDVKDVFDDTKEENENARTKWLAQFLFNGDENKINDVTNGKDILKDIKGINGRFWFFFMSAYNVAVHERLLNEQFLRNTEYWHIEEGACPINTPQLFKYLLFSLMRRQIIVITRTEKDQENIITLIDLLGLIYKNNCERENAIKNFNNLLKLRSTYDKIKYDVRFKPSQSGLLKREKAKEKSPLIESLFIDVKEYDNAFWEHLMHLVYLTAYGTIRQWPDMWEEFRFVKPNLLKAEKEFSDEQNVTSLIEKYIIGLKNRGEL